MLNLESAMAQYPKLRDLNLLKNTDIADLARQIHDQFRMKRSKEDVLPYCLLLLEDIEQRRVPPHPLAAMHMLSCLKEMEEYAIANRHWEWLIQQGEEATDARVFGAAIELLAYQGTPLPHLEELYQEAQQRYSLESFHIYGGHQLQDVVLLQGIITARILNHRWKDAYKAFNNCLRMYPDKTPSRIFELFIYERPAAEAILVFFMACRAGCPPKPAVLTSLLRKVFTRSRDIGTMLKLVYSYVAAGGKPQYHFISPLLNGMLSTIPQLVRLSSEDAATLQLPKVWNMCLRIIDSFAAVGVLPSVGNFNSVITMGGKLRMPELVLIGLKELAARNLNPIPETFVALINAFGNLGDGSQVVASWEGLCETKKQQSHGVVQWKAAEWNALVWSTIATGKTAFLEQQLKIYGNEIHPAIREEILRTRETLLRQRSQKESAVDAKNAAAEETNDTEKRETTVESNQKTPENSSPQKHVSIEMLEREIETLGNIFTEDVIADFSTTKFAFIDEQYSRAPPVDLEKHPHFAKLFQAIYNYKTETSDLSQKSATFVDLRELKVLNWKTINRLLFEAEIHQEALRHQEALLQAGGDARLLRQLERDARRKKVEEFSMENFEKESETLRTRLSSDQIDWEQESAARIQFAVYGEYARK